MADTDLDRVLARLEAGRSEALERLFALLRIPSVSTDPAYAPDCARAADWLARDLSGMGFESRVQPTAGHPLVVAHADGPGPHVLFYGHYDVQPVDPLELWTRDPFDPAVIEEGGRPVITARGASDDKGQVMTFLEACRAWAGEGGPPCRVSVVLEGEEESTGDSLTRFLETNAEEMRADLALVCDTTMWNRETPAITTMLRGIATEEVTVHAATRDLHSGFYGSAAANPLHVLSRALAGLHDDRGRVTLAGFYDQVPEIDPEILAQWEGLGLTAEDFLGGVGLSQPAGETDRSLLEQVWARPTAEVNGVWGGYTGAGFKTVIPADAHAKVSFRLTGDQDPEAVRTAFRAHVHAALPPDCTAEFHAHGGARPIVMDTSAPAFERARRALGEEWPREAAMIGCGGSIPVVGDFKRLLGLDAMLIGFALEDDRIHSPDEKYDLAAFERGARAWARILSALAD